MNLKPIEPGCRCVVTAKCEYLGQECTAIEFRASKIDSETGVEYKNVWSTDLKPIPPATIIWAPEWMLMRIDGHEPDEEDAHVYESKVTQAHRV